MTRTALPAISLENHKTTERSRMRAVRVESTVFLERPTAKSMRVNNKKNFDAAKFCSLQNESWKWTFRERILLSRRIVPFRTTSVPNSLLKQRKIYHFSQMKKLTTFSEANKQIRRRSRKQLFRINCPIINLWSEKTVLRQNLFPWKASKNSLWVKSGEENKIRYKCFLGVCRVSGRSWLNQKNHKHTLCAVG